MTGPDYSSAEVWAVAERVCTPDQLMVLRFRSNGLGWRTICHEVYAETGRYPALSTVRDRWAAGERRILNAMGEEV